MDARASRVPSPSTHRVRDAIRAFNKRVLNPAMLTMAGRRHWYAAVLRHVGRRSGRRYATPVVAVPVPEGFVVPLPYGEQVDWLRNAVAAGGATIQFQGETFEVGVPVLLDAEEALPLLDARHRRAWQRFRIDRFARFPITQARRMSAA
ncbi:nitroreductase family deazaflavin-dependent oxidoreductase [Knoellia sp. p5-6-4]|uniref:nitroreductase family deazaflavin-dependent oxidoreductase n=1 Tax=unclassified Knoellia TaxID=2618719 RepID=UPI0023DBA339|nr:nitroreductase family deazaflavin-dependent oxidoreductase [Knoellia sp. p5-6-4]MDF2143722.1 nitroreductase family deazaflavin-dependent oxidoreductase [Knoellia sp. p5-6-4]